MTLRQKQVRFIEKVAQLIVYAKTIEIDLFINEMYRTKERQEQLYKEGKTKTLNSKHLQGLAVDLIIVDKKGNPVWDFNAYKPLGEYWEKTLGQIWGGNFKTLKDAVHFEYRDE